MKEQAMFLLQIDGRLYGYWTPALAKYDAKVSKPEKVFKLQPGIAISYEEIAIEQIE